MDLLHSYKYCSPGSRNSPSRLLMFGARKAFALRLFRALHIFSHIPGLSTQCHSPVVMTKNVSRLLMSRQLRTVVWQNTALHVIASHAMDKTGLAKKLVWVLHEMGWKTRMNFWAKPIFTDAGVSERLFLPLPFTILFTIALTVVKLSTDVSILLGVSPAELPVLLFLLTHPPSLLHRFNLGTFLS